MKFENKELGLKFEIEEVIAVPIQMGYWALIEDLGFGAKYLRYWIGARMLIKEWEFKPFPDHNGDFAELTDPAITAALMWAGNEVFEYVEGLTAPKNA